MLLTESEIEHLTGYTQTAAQSRWLFQRHAGTKTATSRRSFLAGFLALPALAKANPWVTLDDYAVNGVYDLSAALRDGPVCLLARDYECLPVRFRSRDVIQGIPGRSRLLFESPEPAFLPEDTSQPADGWHFEDFDVQCEAKGARSQHAFGMLSCRRGTLQRIRAFDFGGSALLLFGQRIAFSGPGAPSLDAPCGWVEDEWQCSGVAAPSDSTACRVEDFEAWRCGVGFRLDGTPAPEGVPRVKGGTANMHLFIRPVAYNCDSDGFLVWQGASNTFIKPIAGQCGRNGISVAWYGNVFEGAVLERNSGWGVQIFTQHREATNYHFPYIHNGGSNGLGLCNVTVPEIG